MRDLLSVFFRNRRLIQITFLSTFVGAVLYVVLFGIKYESSTQILVKHRRADEVVSTDTSSRDQMSSTDVPTEREINTEISLLKSGDLMAAGGQGQRTRRTGKPLLECPVPRAG